MGVFNTTHLDVVGRLAGNVRGNVCERVDVGKLGRLVGSERVRPGVCGCERRVRGIDVIQGKISINVQCRR